VDFFYLCTEKEPGMLKRVFTVLLAFYVMVLVFAPCVDEDFSVSGKSEAVVSTESMPVHQDQHDCCSPFCTCSCCSVPFEMMKAFVITNDFPQYGSLTFFFKYQFQTRIDFTIWEPPKA
jgi:hypothetical protein